MSYVHTVLNAVTLPAMPDMKLASSAVSPRPSKPVGKVVQQHVGGGQIVVQFRLAVLIEDGLARVRIHLRRDQSLAA